MHMDSEDGGISWTRLEWHLDDHHNWIDTMVAMQTAAESRID